MSKQVMYVGIDVGCEELWVAIEGQTPKKFLHSKQGIKSLHAWAQKRSGSHQLHFCMEATGVYGISVASQLVADYEAVVSIVNPARIAAFAKVQMKRCKTDKVDAEVIRAYANSQQPVVWQPAPQPLQHLAALVAQADAIKDSLGQWHNRHHAQQFISDLPKVVTHTQRSIERSLKRQLQNMETSITNLCAADPYLAQQVALLCTVPGIAHNTAVRLLAHGKQWLTDTTAKALVAHAGLAPHHHQSGSSIRGKGRVDKRGNAKLRKTLYMPALVAVYHNPILKRFYQRLISKGKNKKLALVAAMKKLLLIIRAILITQKPFNPKIQPLT